MGGEAVAALRREHVLGEGVLFGHVPVRQDLRRIGVLIWKRALRNAVTEGHHVEAVHVAAVARRLIAGILMIEILLDY